MITHFRILFPKGLDPYNFIHLRSDEGELRAEVLFRNIWPDQQNAFAPDADIFVGLHRPDETDIFGKVCPIPAQGLLRGEFRYTKPGLWGQHIAGWMWLGFALRYDMYADGVPWQGDQHTVFTHDQGPPFKYVAFHEPDE
jgi:hypothetical protein